MKTALVLMASVVATEAFLQPISFTGSALMRSRVARSSALRMAEENPAMATFDNLEKEVAVPGGGFWFGSAGFWGEEDYRGFVDSYKPDNLINGVYPIIDRVRDTKILTTTSESGLLSELEDAGLTLSEAEKLLPALEEGGLLDFVADNLDVLINLFGFLAVEPAKIAIPAVVSVVKALKGVGLLKLGSEGGTPALATASVAPASLNSRPKIAAAIKPIVAAAPKPKAVAPPKPKAVAAAIKPVVAAAPKPKAVAAAIKPVVAAAPKPKAVAAAIKPVIAAAPKPKAVAPPKPKGPGLKLEASPTAKLPAAPKKPTPVKKASPPPKAAVSAPKGNISKIPKAL